ncbi:MAG TPA: (2Fe-2S)-binding protein [Oligoflexus sp.]|uniref:(2Fe-2S)-binding protein n=1 Tax=Oligoflexus sp. TaxID=1971216 RepID=UPI002D6047E3|nr:(2Fe-2S)-binding protein [Oligoflexus sp.]HYX38485.1 (2Fe-2S)-binding protein [Oligoflexus sp.]
MIVCLCFGVNHRAIEQLKEQGCDTLRQIQNQCQAGSSCGACIPDLKKSLQEKGKKPAQDPSRSC